MLLFTATTDKLQLVTVPGSGNIDVQASFTDRSQSTGVVGLADKQLTNITGAATTDILAAPGATTTRVLNALSIRNLHASQVTDVIVQYNANATIREIVAYRLFPNDVVFYTTETGWKKFSAATRFSGYGVMGGGTSSVDSVTPVDIPGSSIVIPPLTVDTLFAFEGYATMNTGVTTTGARIGVEATNDGAYGPTAVRQVGISTVTGSVSAAVLGAGTVTSLGSAPVAQTTGPTGAVPFFVWGYIKILASDVPVTLNLFVTTEVVGSIVIIREGAWFHLWEATG